MMRPQPIVFLALGLFGLYCIEFGVVGILPMIMQRFQVTAAQAGWLVSLFALVIAVGGPFLVLLATRWRRKRVLLVSLCVFALTSLISAYAPRFEWLLALRMVPALFHPVYFSLAMVAAATLYPPQQAARASAHAFVGTSLGMVLGIPLTTWIAAQYGYEASFLACALVNALAALGVWRYLPDAPQEKPMAYGHQLAILRKGALWLNIIAAVLVFAAMFSVYAYAAAYLEQVTGLSARQTGLILVVFGVGGVAGNLLAGRLLGMHVLRTVLLQPILLGLAYGLLYRYAGADMGWAGLAVLALFWGAAHTSGLIVTQVWLSGEAQEAPAFAIGVYIAAINLGVTVGALAGGMAIARYGMQGAIASGVLFAVLALVVIVFKAWRYRVPSLQMLGTAE
ncbi:MULTISPECIES: MFS transporter [unclassified Janthinobacterium]|uniref:MFS transporter n=1 Tax=unclassified Janthinobacterium TaxID=2610881 RepID=UPI0016083009|nr:MULTISPECIES: MFS transporter [unclassified Janthinobacterium]MBB5371659.1 putative MFS family arabinose efflux permease [Janthinobacterium sp. K2C7]MBB5384464.1 putative MFS family arabinose efflux permease [Janthinobacterium sp. K2Li3]MBB5389740.1 putative MFS family arabinose efflux permease [Janthinobacterium sp. K2E3]